MNKIQVGDTLYQSRKGGIAELAVEDIYCEDVKGWHTMVVIKE
jgi:hypothetical protein